MKNEEIIEIYGAAEIADDVQKRIKTTGIRGLDFEKAKELGVFNRIGNLLCVMHSTVMAAYRAYGGIDYIIDQMFARRNEISREMNIFEKAFDRFTRFWTNYYTSTYSYRDTAFEIDRLYYQIMRWMQIPDAWQLGDPQHTTDDTELNIKITTDDKTFTFRKAELDNEIVESEESWAVLKYDYSCNKQKSVYMDMDKASAIMIAKRLSDEDKENVYTAAIIREVVEKRTEVTPFKAFKNNETIGKVTKTFAHAQ